MVVVWLHHAWFGSKIHPGKSISNEPSLTNDTGYRVSSTKWAVPGTLCAVNKVRPSHIHWSDFSRIWVTAPVPFIIQAPVQKPTFFRASEFETHIYKLVGIILILWILSWWFFLSTESGESITATETTAKTDSTINVSKDRLCQTESSILASDSMRE